MERYLGDGVYARFDGYSIWLDLRGQDNYTKIALEPEVLSALDEFRREVRYERESKENEPSTNEPTVDPFVDFHTTTQRSR